ncbi:MAG: hypothetical protein RIQ60_652 [Pseudomonadota bacterium]|jgi:hypothetical protein
MTTTRRLCLQPLRHACAVAAACALGTPALAQQSPYYLGAVQGVASDSNVYRAATGSDIKSDVISSTGLRAGVDQPFGRQRWALGAEANVNRYSSQKVLNNNDYQLTSRLEWATLARLSGVLSGGVKQSLYRLDTTGNRQFTQRNMLRSSNLGLQAQLGTVTDLSFDAGASMSRDSYSSVLFAANNLSQQSVNAGLRLRPGSGLMVRVGLRHGTGHYASNTDRLQRDDVDLATAVELSGASTVNARLSRTLQRHDAPLQPDSRSWTGALGWNWRPLGKLAFDLNLSRDGSVGAVNFDNQIFNLASSDTRTQTRLALRADWDLAAAWKIGSEMTLLRRDINTQLLLNNVAQGAQDQNDRTVALNFGVRYLPTRNVELGCNVGREDRSTDAATVNAVTYAYAVTTASCTAQIYLR